MNNVLSVFSEQEVQEACLKYFNGDSLAAQVAEKYLLKNKQNNFVEKTPDDMHVRLAKEFYRIEDKFANEETESAPLKYEVILEQLLGFKNIVPQGSPMYGIGNSFQTVSLSNCVVVESPEDDMSSIMDTGKSLAQLFKRRCGVGVDISSLRWDGAHVNNAAGSSTRSMVIF